MSVANTTPPPPAASRSAHRILGNAYRVLGVGSGASQAEIHAANQTQKRSQKLGSQKRTPWDLNWIDTPERTPATLLDAIGRLAKPDSRLRERLFWFDEEPVQGPPAMPPPPHDRAVRLMLEALLADPDAEDEPRWSTVGASWREVVEDSAYWQRMLSTDVEGGFEPPAANAEVDAIRAETLSLALEPVASRGRAAAFAGDVEVATRCLRILRAAGLDEASLNQLEQSLAGPVVAEIHQICEKVQAGRAEVLREADSIDKDLPVCERNQAAFEPLMPLLLRLQTLVGEANPLVLEAKEELAVLLHQLALDWTWADEFARSRDLMVRAQAIGAGTPAEYRIAERIAELDEPAKRERARQDFFRSNKVYEVTVGGTYTVPSACTCCLGPADRSRLISGVYTSGNTKTTIKMSLPICSACLAHGSNSSDAVFLQSMVGFAILVTSYLFLRKEIFTSLPWLILAVFAFGLTTWLMFLIAKKQKLIPLTKNCASRHFPVEMAAVGPGYARVKFMNPDYAQAFADLNQTQVKQGTASKMNREGATLALAEGFPGILGRQGLVLLTAAILCGILSFLSPAFVKFMFAPLHSEDAAGISDTAPVTTPTPTKVDKPSTFDSTPFGASGMRLNTTGGSLGASTSTGSTGLGALGTSPSTSSPSLSDQLATERSTLATIRTEYDARQAYYELQKALVDADRSAYDKATPLEQDSMRAKLNQEINDSNKALHSWQEVEGRLNQQVEVVNNLVRQYNQELGR